MDAYARRIGFQKAEPVFGMGDVFTVTLSSDTNAYADGDVLNDTQLVSANAFLEPGGTAFIHSIRLLDKDDQKIAMDVYFLNTSTSMGTENSAPNISDANAEAIIGGPIRIATTDYSDIGGCSVAKVNAIGALIKAPAASTSLWVATITRSGTPTYSASGLILKVGLVY